MFFWVRRRMDQLSAFGVAMTTAAAVTWSADSAEKRPTLRISAASSGSSGSGRNKAVPAVRILSFLGVGKKKWKWKRWNLRRRIQDGPLALQFRDAFGAFQRIRLERSFREEVLRMTNKSSVPLISRFIRGNHIKHGPSQQVAFD